MFKLVGAVDGGVGGVLLKMVLYYIVRVRECDD